MRAPWWRRPGTRTPRRRRLLTPPRRVLAAVLLAVATGLAVDAVAAGPPPGVTLVVAARDLPTGHAVAEADLTRVVVPPSAVPDGALDAEDLTGDGVVLASPVRRGEPLTDARLTGPGLLAAAPPGSVAVPVRVVEAAALRLVRPGDEVTVLAGPDLSGLTGGEVVVPSAVVLHVPDTDDGLLAGDAGGGGVVVLALDRPGATRVAAAAGQRPLLLGLLP